LGLFDQCICCINYSFNTYTKLLSNQCLVDGDLITTNNHSNVSILSGLPSVQKHFQQIYLWHYLVNNEQATQTSSFYPLLLFRSHLDPLQHFLDFFCFNKCLLMGHFGKWTTLLHLFFSLMPHHALGSCLGGYNMYAKRIKSNSKEPSFNQLCQKIY